MEFNVKPGCPNLIERIESGLLSYGNDFDNQDNPFECGFEKYVNLESDVVFLGKEKLKKIKSDGIKRKLMGVQIETNEISLTGSVNIMNNDGYLIITCPDLRSVCKEVANNNLTGVLYQSGAGPISALDILYGLRPSLQDGNHYMAHKCGFTADVLRESLVQFGFGRAVIATIPQRYVLWGIATKISEADWDFLLNTLKSHTTLLQNAKLAKS